MPSPTTTSSPSPQSPILSSGILTTSTGERHIPSSIRADGSLRKEIKIRPGYRPPEDVEVYKNRTAETWKARGSGGVPGADGLHEGGGEAGKGAAGKNAKRREARKKARAAEGEGQVNGEGLEKAKKEKEAIADWNRAAIQMSGADAGNEKAPARVEEDIDQEAEKEKQARNLKKKLRQARELKEKKESGENLLPEQFAKVIKIQELIRQLDGLGFDSEGLPKEKSDQ